MSAHGFAAALIDAIFPDCVGCDREVQPGGGRPVGVVDLEGGRMSVATLCNECLALAGSPTAALTMAVERVLQPAAGEASAAPTKVPAGRRRAA